MRNSLRSGALGGALLTMCALLAGAQRPAPSSLYRPRAVEQAYRKGTRSPDGRPGPRYWQNHARYRIRLTALPPDRTVRGA